MPLSYLVMKEGQDKLLRDIFRICSAIKTFKSKYETEKAQTVIGAAIFYGPQDKSRQCQGRSQKSRAENEQVKDHVYSRKESGRYFMDNDMNEDEFCSWYWEKASIWVYVTKKENQILKSHQQTVDAYKSDWRETYEKAGIVLTEEYESSRTSNLAVPTPDAQLLV